MPAALGSARTPLGPTICMMTSIAVNQQSFRIDWGEWINSDFKLFKYVSIYSYKSIEHLTHHNHFEVKVIAAEIWQESGHLHFC
jgi:hypothetical protein